MKKKYSSDEERKAAKNARRRTPEARAVRNAERRERYALDAEYRADQKRKSQAYRAANRESCAEYLRAWGLKNNKTDKVRERSRLSARRRRATSGDACRAYKRSYDKTRYSTDEVYRLIKNARSRISKALRGAAKVGKFGELLGCSGEEFRSYIEPMLAEGMTWENYSHDGWHVDHIRPLSSFDLTDPAQQRIAFHYTNCQPLWAFDNLSKGARVSA